MALCDDATIERLGMTRGGMMLIDTEQAGALYDAMGPAREISGGSAANTQAGLAQLGAKCAFIGQVAVARTPLTPYGYVFIQGERWSACLEQGSADEGAHVHVTAVDGLQLYVRLEVQKLEVQKENTNV